MPSPFPGMNPYLEQAGIWPEFHGAFIYRLRAQLAAQVAPRYFVRVSEHVYIREMPDHPARLVGQPDLSVTGSPGVPAAEAGSGTVAAPATVQLVVPATIEERTSFLEIIDIQGDSVVTVVELLSPSNKYAGPDAEQYRIKRSRLLRSGINYVELDLLRGGPRTVAGLPECDYYALVARAAEFPRAGVWPWRLRDPFPRIPVPLRPGEPDPTVDLRSALETAYDEAGYAYFIYRGDPEPALAAEDAAWAAAFVPRPGPGAASDTI
jgi:hypothetical protein